MSHLAGNGFTTQPVPSAIGLRAIVLMAIVGRAIVLRDMFAGAAILAALRSRRGVWSD
jgi:hypothetical protein